MTGGYKLTDASLDSLTGLAELPRSELIKRWRSFYRCDPPKGITRKLLLHALAYEMQAKRSVRLNPSTARRLRAIAAGTAQPQQTQRKAVSSVQPGTRLIREWHGVTHTVVVVENGVIWNGMRYPSLTAVARTITGARWSGPRFFGLLYKKTK